MYINKNAAVDSENNFVKNNILFWAFWGAIRVNFWFNSVGNTVHFSTYFTELPCLLMYGLRKLGMLNGCNTKWSYGQMLS